jgi:hypothetical protein
MLFLATSVAFDTAAVTSAPLAVPTPTLPLPSPITTSARNLNLRTTLNYAGNAVYRYDSFVVLLSSFGTRGALESLVPY